MPILSQITFPINVEADKISLLNKVAESISSCGCTKTKTLASDLRVALPNVIEAAKQLAGDSIISCDPAVDNCCPDSASLDLFISKMKSMRET